MHVECINLDRPPLNDTDGDPLYGPMVIVTGEAKGAYMSQSVRPAWIVRLSGFSSGVHEPILHIDGPFPIFGRFMDIASICLHGICKLVVSQINVEYVLTNETDMLRVFKREEKLHTAV